MGAEAALEEEEWAANPWQAQADAHMRHLQQAQVLASAPQLAAAPQLPAGEGTGGGGFVGVGGGVAFGVPALLCSVALPTQSREELARQILDLEGQVALLEERLAERQRELELARFAPPPRGSIPVAGQAGTGPPIEELQRKNDFLSVLVSRFQRKTMALEEELAVLTLAKRDAEAQAASARGSQADSPLSASGGILLQSTADSAAQTTEDLVRKAEDLEDLAANLEELLAGRDRALAEARARLGDAELQARASREGPHVSELEAEAEEMRARNGFLAGIVARYEQKTMDLESQLGSAAAARREASATSEEAMELRAELRAARAEASQWRGSLEAAEEGLRERQEELDGSAVVLRDLKREHNRKMQEALRRAQASESRGAELDAERRRVEALEAERRRLEAERQEAERRRLEAERLEAAAAALPPAAPAAAAASAAELEALRALNAQLAERLAKERSLHAETRQSLEAASQDNEVLCTRIGRLTEQLVTLASANDSLEERLSAGGARP